MTVGIAAATLNSWLDGLCRSVTWAEPAGIFFKLHTGDPGANGTANAAANTTRQQGTFAAASGGAITTSADTVWTNVPNAETYSHWSAWDAAVAGTFLGSDDLTAPVAVTVGNTFTIPAGDIDISIAPVAA